ETGGKTSISEAQRRALQAKHGYGSWTVSGAVFGPSKEALEPQIRRVQDVFLKSGKGRDIPNEEAVTKPPLKITIDSFSGVPTSGELGLLKWRPGGGNTWCVPGTPMVGKIANKFQKEARVIYDRHGLDYTIMNVCGARFMRGLHVITFNRENSEE